MPATCNACGSNIDTQDINVQADTALCRHCGTASSYSALVHAPTAGMYTAPPAGCHVEDLGARWRAVASTRSWRAVPIAGFATLWNGFLCLFLGGILFSTKGPPLFIVLFLSGHIAVGVYVAWQAICLIVGDVEVVIENGVISVGSGVGPLRRRRRRPFSEVRGVRVEAANHRARQITPGQAIVLDGPSPLKFGSLLNDERRQFLHAVLAAELLRRHQPPYGSPET